MALTFRQKRQLTMIFGVAFALVVLGATIGKPVQQAVFGPSGYAKKAPLGNHHRLDWDELMKGTQHPGEQAVVPGNIAAWHEERVVVRGYLLPLHAGREASQFHLAPKPGNCYFCTPPGVTEVIEINLADDKKLPLTDHAVTAYGKFRVTNGIGFSIYNMDDVVLSLKE